MVAWVCRAYTVIVGFTPPRRQPRRAHTSTAKSFSQRLVFWPDFYGIFSPVDFFPARLGVLGMVAVNMGRF